VSAWRNVPFYGFLLLVTDGCWSESTHGSVDKCKEGQITDCTHPSGCTSYKVCKADGTFGACECVDLDAGFGGAGGSGGTAGGAGVPGGGAGGGTGAVGANGGTGGVINTGGSGGTNTGGAGGLPSGGTGGLATGGTGGLATGGTGGACFCPPNQICQGNLCACNCAQLAPGTSCVSTGCRCPAVSNNNNSDKGNCGCDKIQCPNDWNCVSGTCMPP